MPDDRYRLGESLRLIGNSLDHRLDPPERSEKILELLRVLAEINVPAAGGNGTPADRQPASHRNL